MGQIIDALKKVINIDTIIQLSHEFTMEIPKTKVGIGIFMEIFFKQIQSKLNKGSSLEELSSLQGGILSREIFGDSEQGLYQMISMGFGYDEHQAGRVVAQLVGVVVASLYILQAEKNMDNEEFIKLIKKDQRHYESITQEQVYKNPKNVVGLARTRRARVYDKVVDIVFLK